MLRRPGERFIDVFALDDVVASELFFGFGERTVGHHHLFVAHSNGGGVARGAKATALQIHSRANAFLQPNFQSRLDLGF